MLPVASPTADDSLAIVMSSFALLSSRTTGSTISAFSTFVLAGNVLSPEIAFTSLALFDIMMEPAQEFGWALNDLVLIWASLKRVGRFLTTQDLDDSVVKQLPGSVSGNSRVAVRLCFGGAGSFCWGKAPPPDKESKEMRRLLTAAGPPTQAAARPAAAGARRASCAP